MYIQYVGDTLVLNVMCGILHLSIYRYVYHQAVFYCRVSGRLSSGVGEVLVGCVCGLCLLEFIVIYMTPAVDPQRDFAWIYKDWN